MSSASFVFPPFPVFPDVDGEPLEAGYIYIGLSGLDAEANPKQAYWDEALTIPATQPIRTVGGYPVRSGSPASIYVDGDYSITTRNKNGSFIYSSLQSTVKIPGSSVTGLVLSDSNLNTYDDLRNLDPSNYSVGDVVYVSGDYIFGNFKVESGSATDDGGITITNATWNAAGKHWKRQIENYVLPTWFGATGEDDSVDETAFFQAAIDACDQGGGTSVYNYKSVFVPSPIDGYKITGLNMNQRVDIIGENMWCTRLVIENVGEYGISYPHRVENLWFDGDDTAGIQNGTYRIDEASWSSNREAYRGNTGVILNLPNGAAQNGHGFVFKCRFSKLAVGVERGTSINTSVSYCYISDCWHGIFNRADGGFQFASMLVDQKNYIVNNQGVCIGFYPNANGYNQYDFSGCILEFSCQAAAHKGINGYFDTFNASIKTPRATGVYFETDSDVDNVAIAIRAGVLHLSSFFIQEAYTPIKAPSVGAYWRLYEGEFVGTQGPYDADLTGVSVGRSLFEQIAFSKGLNAAAIPFCRVIDSSASKILPNSNSNWYQDDAWFYSARQGAACMSLNRRASNGLAQEWWRNGVMAQSLEVQTTSTAVRDSGTTDGTTANKLVDSTQNFVSTVSVGDVVKNTTDNTFATITAVDSNTQLSLDNDIMVSGESYIIYFAPTSSFTKPIGPPVLTVAEMNKFSASRFAGRFVFVSDDAVEGYTLAFSNGTNWRVLNVSGNMS